MPRGRNDDSDADGTFGSLWSRDRGGVRCRTGGLSERGASATGLTFGLFPSQRNPSTEAVNSAAILVCSAAPRLPTVLRYIDSRCHHQVTEASLPVRLLGGGRADRVCEQRPPRVRLERCAHRRVLFGPADYDAGVVPTRGTDDPRLGCLLNFDGDGLIDIAWPSGRSHSGRERERGAVRRARRVHHDNHCEV